METGKAETPLAKLPSWVNPKISVERGSVSALIEAGGPLAPGYSEAICSVVSPGTERRSVRDGRRYPGYMNIVQDGGGKRWLVPSPHGAAVRLDDAVEALPLREETSERVAALARFQIIAALGFGRMSSRVGRDTACVIGTGPVAVGAVLELIRQGVRSIDVVSRRGAPRLEGYPGVRVLEQPEPSEFVLDCAGDPARALELVSIGGSLGLLGTGVSAPEMSGLDIHRRNISVIGMHELAGIAVDSRVRCFYEVQDWLAVWPLRNEAESLVEMVNKDDVPKLYGEILSGPRRSGLVSVLQW